MIKPYSQPLIALALCFPLTLAGCARRTSDTARGSGQVTSAGTRNVFDEYLQSDIPPADGFDFPVGNKDGQGSYRDKATGTTHAGWYVATHFTENYNLGIHTGEDWNGRGGGNTDLGQEVFAVANGRVSSANAYGEPWGNVVVIDHLFYENNEKKQIRSVYAHLQSIAVKAGQAVLRRQLIGTVGQDPDKQFNAHLHLELRWDESLSPTYWPSSIGKDIAWIRAHYAEPTSFITQHRGLFVPQDEPTLVLVDQQSYEMRVYQRQKLLGEYQVSLGQGKGPKRVEGDRKTPTGMYFVINKHQGKFDGEYAPYYGGYWIKINYPNSFDAVRGRKEGLLNAKQETEINKLWSGRAPSLENTGLGGGIGFHGWIREWDNTGARHLSFGCVVLHLNDIRALFDKINEGTMVVIF